MKISPSLSWSFLLNTQSKAGQLISGTIKEMAAQNAIPSTLPKHRKLGTLEVSAVGLGVQNMSRTYQTKIPSRTEMHNIIRKAFDHGVTLIDAAGAYGPVEVE